VADGPYFRKALRTRDFALSDYLLISRVYQTPGLIATYPAVKGDGSLDLHWIGELAANAARRDGTSVLLVDSSGTLMAASARSSARTSPTMPWCGRR
jgi:hypothetical protein